MLEDRPQNWNHQHWSHAWFDDETRVSLYLWCPRIPPVSLMQQSASLSTTWRTTGAHTLQFKRMTMDSSANSTWDECWWFQLWCLRTNMRRWSRVSLRHRSGCQCLSLSEIQLLLNIIGLYGKRQAVQFSWSAPPWFWTSGYGKRHGLLLMWMSLTHWGRDKMHAISQTPFSNAIFLNENIWIPINISLKFIPKGPINYIPAWVQKIAWRRSGDKLLSELIMINLLTHICVTRPQWAWWRHQMETFSA